MNNICRFFIVFSCAAAFWCPHPAQSQDGAGVIWHVSTAGDDSAAGSADHPFKTISRAAQAAMPGDTVLVRAGVYRERVSPPRGGATGKPIVYRAVRGDRVFVKGSMLWRPGWRDEGGGVYSAVPADELFDDRSPEYVDHHNPFKVRLASTPWGQQGLSEAILRDAGEDRIGNCDESIAYTCGQVFVNKQRYLEVPVKGELAAECWWYEPGEGRVFVHFGKKKPMQQTIELTTRRRIFAPIRRGLGHIVVEGFIFEHSGNQYPTNFWKIDANAQKGAVGTEAGHHWVIRRNVIRHAKTFALDVGMVDRHGAPLKPRDVLVEENYILDNGSAGILSNGSERLVIRGNVILRNNQLRFIGIKRWEQAGVKCHSFDEGLIEGNYIASNYKTYGIWLDNQFLDCRVTRNIIRDNGRAGVFLEMSDYGFDSLLIDHNIVLDNHENAIYIHDASGATFVHNILANTRSTKGYGQAVYARQLTERTRTGYHTFSRNLIIGNAKGVEVNYPVADRSGPYRFDGNIYSAASREHAFVVNARSDKPVPWSESVFAQLIHRDVGNDADGLRIEGQVAQMTLETWCSFWRTHRLLNDVSSQLLPKSEVEYDAATHDLTIGLARDLPISDLPRGSMPESVDYFGQKLSAEQPVVAGPFQSLTRRQNTFRIWDGLPFIAQDQLPNSQWTQ